MRQSIAKTNLPQHLYSGKVRDTYMLDEENLIMVSTDRISAFDVVMNQPIPGKGVILNSMSSFWLEKTKNIIPNHFVINLGDAFNKESFDFSVFENHIDEGIKKRSMIVKKAKRIDIECIVRGYLAGSAWTDYQKNKTINEKYFKENFSAAEKFSSPIFTPSTKAESGHDVPLSEKDGKNLIGEEMYNFLEKKSIEIYNFAHDFSLEKGIILVDTKFEFGTINDEIILIDELLTPDSSRYWDYNQHEIGTFPPAFDKQFLREWLLNTNWNMTYPPPEIPDNIINVTKDRYLESYERLTNKNLII
ncbi:MAG: phosphoribosylaminoimidazolesuccinocarboxamide synthase [Dehalococcoidia bacterium]